MGDYTVLVRVNDSLTKKLKHKLNIYPKIAYDFFIHPSVRMIEQVTTPFVPMNSNPPADEGKWFAGTLQSGFYESKGKTSLVESVSVFGYRAYDTAKNEQYAGEVETNDEYEHPERYTGHRPQSGYTRTGIKESVAKGVILDVLKKRYIQFLTQM